MPVSGIVDLAGGHAFVRTSGYRRAPDDVYISAGQIGPYGLRKGDRIEGTARPDGARTNGAGPMRPGAASSGRCSGWTRSTGCRPNSPGPARTSTT